MYVCVCVVYELQYVWLEHLYNVFIVLCLLRGIINQHISVQLPDTRECGKSSLRSSSYVTDVITNMVCVEF